MNKRALRRRLNESMACRGYLGSVIITMRVPWEYERWSPGPEWVEAASGYCWFKPSDDGQHEVAVVTYDRTHTDADEYHEALVTARVERDTWWWTFVDKPHRIYGRALPGTLKIEQLTPEAGRYHHLTERVSQHFDRTICSVGRSWPYLTLSSRASITAEGDGWMLSVDAHTDTVYYWEDLNDLTAAVNRLIGHYEPAKVYITRRAEEHLIDPLWGPAITALRNAEER